jgi:hypothetical protein
MHRLFSDLVLSHDGATARRARLAFPASLMLHAAAATVVVLVAVLRQDALPHVERGPGAGGDDGDRAFRARPSSVITMTMRLLGLR